MQEEGWSTTVDGRALPVEPADMAPGAVYLSTGRGDVTAAERLSAILDEAGLDVWFDRNEVREGPQYERRINQYLQQCDLFIPLLSPATEEKPDALLRREWDWALEREQTHGDGSFVLPVWIGDAAPPGNTPAPFRRLNLHAAPGGSPTGDFVRECVEAVRRERAQRNV
jgi:hypothetical protein